MVQSSVYLHTKWCRVLSQMVLLPKACVEASGWQRCKVHQERNWNLQNDPFDRHYLVSNWHSGRAIPRDVARGGFGGLNPL